MPYMSPTHPNSVLICTHSTPKSKVENQADAACRGRSPDDACPFKICAWWVPLACPKRLKIIQLKYMHYKLLVDVSHTFSASDFLLK